MAEDIETLVQSSRRPAASPREVREATGSVDERPDLTVAQILAWADAHHAAHGEWPDGQKRSGFLRVEGVPEESWQAINHALALGLRGLPGDSSLGELLAEHRGAPVPDMRPEALAEKIWAWEQEHFPIKRPRIRLAEQAPAPALTIPGILAWADAHHAATGKWPKTRTGPVREAPFHVTWSMIHRALQLGRFGLPGGSSLSRLLAEHSGVALPLSCETVLAWADAYRAAMGCWPSENSGAVTEAPWENWHAVDRALRTGARGLPRGLSIPRLLAKYRGYRNPQSLPELTVTQILAWADAYQAVHGCWPTERSGPITGTAGESWMGISGALKDGCRGLSGGSSLARLLAQYRGHQNRKDLPGLTMDQVLGWAAAHHAATGKWPTTRSGPVRDAPFALQWLAVDKALREGKRGLRGGLSLARLLPRSRPVRSALPLERILAWADAHHAATGNWPVPSSGKVAGGCEKWNSIDACLRHGHRGLPGGQSLRQILAEHRGAPYVVRSKTLSIEQILAWADAHHALRGCWPDAGAGPIDSAPGETWRRINSALRIGSRGLPGATTLVGLLTEKRGRERPPIASQLTIEQILAWADAHHTAYGQWPNAHSGPIAEEPTQSWAAIDTALSRGRRGMSGGMTLSRLLAENRLCGAAVRGLELSIDQILAWADAHHARHGRWPGSGTGPVEGAPFQTWTTIDKSLRCGLHGLPGRSSLVRLLAERRGRKPNARGARLTVEQILAWADAHHAAHGRWPSAGSGPVADAPMERWSAIDSALTKGNRGLSGGSSLADLLAQHRGRRKHSGGSKPAIDSPGGPAPGRLG